MQIGIIAEGREDQAVLKNIMRAFGLDGSDIRAIIPSSSLDETDKNGQNHSIGTFQGVKNACLSKIDFENFFNVLDNQYIVIHLDTAEIDRQDFHLTRPPKKDNSVYCTELRTLVVEQINKWLEGKYAEELFYAICIEEMEAWCLTIYLQQDTAISADPKRKLGDVLARENLNDKNCRDISDFFENKVSKKFRKLKSLKTCAEHNLSLKEFVESLEKKLKTP